MKIKVLGASGAELPGYCPPAYLIDGSILLDAGTIGTVLSEKEQWKIRHIIISHAHLDHIRTIPFLADNIIIKNKKHFITIIGIKEVLKQLREHLLNNNIWPDFTIIGPNGPVLRLREIRPEEEIQLNSLIIRAVEVNHSVPAVGYVIKEIKGKKVVSSLVYTGDTGQTNRIWQYSSGADGLIVEVSFPNRLTDLAIKTGHLTPRLLKAELKKIENLPRRIFVTHPKPQYIDIIKKELISLKIKNLRLLKEGERIEL